MKHIDYIFGFLGIALSAFVLYLVASFPEVDGIQVGSDFFPKILASGLAFFCLLLIISTFLQKVHLKIEPLSIKNAGTRRSVICVTATVIYCLILETFGFFACTIVYLLFLMFMMKERNYLLMIVSSCVITATIFTVFSLFLNITLPTGELYGF